MSEVSPESALALRQAIIGHDTWNERMPRFAGLTHEGFVAIDGGRVEHNQLPADTLVRLGVMEQDADDGSVYKIEFGRKLNGHMHEAAPEGQSWDPAYVYDDYGANTAFMRVGRSRVGESGVDVLRFARYTVSAQESYEPGQPPLCEAEVVVEDRLPLRQLIVGLNEKGGSMGDMAKAMNIDPIIGEHNIDKPEVTSDTDLRVNLAKELGEPLSTEEVAGLREDETVAAEMQKAETELHPLTTTEILGLAALARSVQPSVYS